MQHRFKRWKGSGISATDVMYVGSYTFARPNQQQIWMVGTEIVRYDNWSTTKNLRWRFAAI